MILTLRRHWPLLTEAKGARLRRLGRQHPVAKAQGSESRVLTRLMLFGLRRAILPSISFVLATALEAQWGTHMSPSLVCTTLSQFTAK